MYNGCTYKTYICIPSKQCIQEVEDKESQKVTTADICCTQSATVYERNKLNRILEEKSGIPLNLSEQEALPKTITIL